MNSRVKSDIFFRVRILAPYLILHKNSFCDNGKTNDERSPKQHGVNVFAIGSLVHITSYSPFQGHRGTIHKVDTISDDLEEPFCFYLVALDGIHMKEPIWFEYNEVELVGPPLVAFKANH